MKNNKRNTEFGITLVGLVVTIIVLLILAGVSINLVLGNNGILNKEQEQMEIAEDIAASYEANSLASNVKVGDYVSYSPKSGETTGELVKGSYDGDTGSGSYENWSTIDENGNTTASGIEGTGYDDNQIFTVPNDTSAIKWRVLSVENGVVNLVSEKEIGRNGLWTGDWSDTLYLQDITGYAYAETIINKVCSIYGTGTGAKSTRSITIEDINKLSGYDVTKDSDYSSKYGNSYGWDNYIWKYTYYDYGYNESGLNLLTADENSTPFSLAFGGDILDNPTGYSYYWLASRYVISYSSCADFSVRFVCNGSVSYSEMFNCNWNGDTDYFGVGYPVRPVVSLKSSVKLTGGEGTSENPYEFE